MDPGRRAAQQEVSSGETHGQERQILSRRRLAAREGRDPVNRAGPGQSRELQIEQQSFPANDQEKARPEIRDAKNRGDQQRFDQNDGAYLLRKPMINRQLNERGKRGGRERA